MKEDDIRKAMEQAWMEQEMHRKFKSGNLKKEDHLGVDKNVRIISRWILQKQCMRVWSGFKRFRICTSGRLSRKA
jgi:hypothetical protein